MKSWMSVVAPGLLLSAVACGGAAPVQPERPVAAAPVCPPCAQAAPATAAAPAPAPQCPQAVVTEASALSLRTERWDSAVQASFLRVTGQSEYDVHYAVFNFSFTNPSAEEFAGFVLPALLPATAVPKGTALSVSQIKFLTYNTAEGTPVVIQRVGSSTPFSIVWVPPKKRFVLNNFMIQTNQPDTAQITLSIPVTSLANAMIASPNSNLNSRDLMKPVYDMAKLNSGQYTLDVSIKDQHNMPITSRSPRPGETWSFSFNELRTAEVAFPIAR